MSVVVHDRPSYHNAYVQVVGNRTAFFASCPSCGCDQFPDRETLEEAQSDADQHRMSYERWHVQEGKRADVLTRSGNRA